MTIAGGAPSLGTPIIRAHPQPGLGGGPSILYRRLKPETILRQAGAQQAMFNGAVAVWVFAGWAQHLTAVQFGANPRRLAQFIINNAIGIVQVGAGAQNVWRQWQYEIGTGLVATPPTTIHQLNAAERNEFVVATADAATNTQVGSGRSQSYPCYFPLVAANTPIATRAAKSDGAGINTVKEATAWYSDPLPAFASRPLASLGARECWPNLGVAVMTSAIFPAYGAYVDVFPGPNFTAPADMLVEHITLVKDNAGVPSNLDCIFQAGIGAPGAEVVHAEGACVGPNAGFNTMGEYRFWPPFQVLAGERLRFHNTSTAVQAWEFQIQTARM